MTRRCELTGKLPMSGQLRSHAENKSKRTFRPNLCEVTLISDALQRKVRLRISAHALKSVERRGGLDAFLMKAKEEELSQRCRKRKREVKKAQSEEATAAESHAGLEGLARRIGHSAGQGNLGQTQVAKFNLRNLNLGELNAGPRQVLFPCAPRCAGRPRPGWALFR